MPRRGSMTADSWAWVRRSGFRRVSYMPTVPWGSRASPARSGWCLVKDRYDKDDPLRKTEDAEASPQAQTRKAQPDQIGASNAGARDTFGRIETDRAPGRRGWARQEGNR